MKIFCDTNIVLEFLQQRTQAQAVEDVLSFASSRHDDLCISIGSFYTLTYLVEGYLKRDQHLAGEDKLRELREILNGILDSFSLVDAISDSIKRGVADLDFSDLEDSYQAHIAEDYGCDVLLTINKKHFERFAQNASLSVLTPIEFLNVYVKGEKTR